jgi:hypothetical protein
LFVKRCAALTAPPPNPTKTVVVKLAFGVSFPCAILNQLVPRRIKDCAVVLAHKFLHLFAPLFVKLVSAFPYFAHVFPLMPLAPLREDELNHKLKG